jgi:tetratricopeptide (TPR) repeat protein
MAERTISDRPTAVVDGRDPVEDARIAFLAGELEKARTLADEVLQADPDCIDAWIIKGRALICRYDPASAMECFDRAILLDKGSSEAWKRKAFAYRVSGNTRKAVICWEKALELGAEDPKILTHIGSALDELADYSGAIMCYERVLRIDPNNKYASMNITLNKRILRRLEGITEGDTED